jgi:hypothetical protein
VGVTMDIHWPSFAAGMALAYLIMTVVLVIRNP